jgi:hypothetical protein
VFESILVSIHVDENVCQDRSNDGLYLLSEDCCALIKCYSILRN